jgi:hypothetical protein
MRLMNLFQPCENFLQVIKFNLKRFTRLTRFTARRQERTNLGIQECGYLRLAQARFADLRETLFSNDVGVLPLGETALARQFEISALSGMETSQPRPMMTGPTKSEERRGIKLSHRSPEGVRTVSTSGDMRPESELDREIQNCVVLGVSS